MILGDRLRQIRESKGLSQGDVERRTNLLRCYVSRVENGHTIPSIDTLEKWARAMDVELYQIFYGGDRPQMIKVPNAKNETTRLSVKNRREVEIVAMTFTKLRERDKSLVKAMVSKLARSAA
jgi:transcriptional regulator with XRE-family HTH domain